MGSIALAVVGCGLRAECFLRQIGVGTPGCPVRLAALADPKPAAVEHYRRRYSVEPEAVRGFDTGPQMLDAMGGELDAIIIASPNAYHRETLVPALGHDLVTLLEKPVATTPEDCAAMWRAHQEHLDVPLMIGFVLRFSPFYRTVKRLIDEGALGQVLSVTATEEMNASLSSVFVRDWRRTRSICGPLMLEKCSHDMDILNWLIGSQPSRVASFARRTHLVPRPDAADRCPRCRYQDTCRYSPQNLEPYVIDPEQITLAGGDFGPMNDLCVYNIEKDVPDHQVVNLEYPSGVLATFAVVMDQPITTRTIKVLGTHAQLVGDVRRNQLTIIRHAATRHQQVTQEPITIVRDGSGHDGADSGISARFLAMMRREASNLPWPSIRDGIDASLVALAADQASREGRVVDMGELGEIVYGDTSAVPEPSVV